MAKSKWYFAVPVVVLLLIDQSIKIHEDHVKNKDEKYNKKNIEIIRNIISGLIFTLIFSGSILYGIHQYQEHKNEFDAVKVFLGIGCDKY